MKISFVVPALNAERTIEKCLKSILELKAVGHELEVIVVDNNSTDRTSALASAFKRVNSIRETRQGRSFARNKGMEAATGELIAFIDADVFLHEDWLTESLTNFDDQTIGGTQGPIIPADVDGQKSLNAFRIRNSEEGTKGSYNLLALAVKESPMINSAACLYRRSALLKVGGFDPNLKRHEDIDLSKRILLSGFNLAISPRAKAYVIYNGTGWCSYLKRSFEDGFTKGDYLNKWKDHLFKGASGTKESNLSFFLDEVVFNAYRAIRRWDSYFFLKALSSLFKAGGRLFKAMVGRNLSPQTQYAREDRFAFVFIDKEPIIEFNLQDFSVRDIRNRK